MKDGKVMACRMEKHSKTSNLIVEWNEDIKSNVIKPQKFKKQEKWIITHRYINTIDGIKSINTIHVNRPNFPVIKAKTNRLSLKKCSF